MSRIREYVKSRRKETLEELKDLLRIPSISASPESRADVDRCAEMVVRRMAEAGLRARLLDTGGHPAAFGEVRASDGGPTVLIYGHYDVQPPDPLDLWKHAPFDPFEEDGLLFARGASDDKGQFYALLKGVQACLETRGSAPVNVKILIEGEEEIGSPSLGPLVERERDLLACDVAFIADGNLFTVDLPAITYGLRGLVYLEVVVRGPSKDLHSGSYGGTVANPANVLARILAACQGPFGRVAIPGFYDDVRALEEWERAMYAALPFDEEAYRTELGAPRLCGEEGYSTLERRWARPTLDVNGLVSGYTEEGAKTVIPCEARAKLSMRLVPEQDPERIVELTSEFIRSMAPSGVGIDIVTHHSARPVLVPREGRAVRAAVRAGFEAFGREPVFIREGGSIPVVAHLEGSLGAPSVLFGLGLPDDGAHAPNERLRLEDFYRGMVLMGTWLEELARGD